jgi:tetratricopeptide (TPR) repeat protein
MNEPQALQHALNLVQAGRAEECLARCNEILARSPGLIQGLYLRGCAAFLTGDIDRSTADLQIVHDSHPEHLHAAYYLGRSLRAAGRYEQALAPLQAALGEKEIELSARYELATCLTRLRRRPEAIDQCHRFLELQPGDAQMTANLASLLERENRLEEAARWVDRALGLEASNETAQMTRATLDRRSGKLPEALDRLRNLTTTVAHPVNRSIVWNQLGQCAEGLGDWEKAYAAFTQSNRILQKHHPGPGPDPKGPHGLQTLARIRDWLQNDPMVGWSAPANEDAGGIAFLVGFPRSGTTLLDRMLSAHPEIEVLEEKSLFSNLHQDWSEPGTLEALAEVSTAQIADAREIYRREMSCHRRNPERSLVIDKLPLNLAYLFLIHRLFPHAPVLFLQRHPLDVCLSCYFQAFELEASMAYFLDIHQTAQYYDAVMQVAVLSLDQVSNPVHRMRYEDLVAEPKAQLKPCLEFLSVGWDDSILNYRQISGGTSNTPSYQQVSQPLHSRSIGKWRHYTS